MGQIKLMTSLILIALFTIAITTYAIKFADDNDSEVTLTDSNYPGINRSLQSDTQTFKSDANTSVEAIGKTTVSTSTEATEGGTAFKVGPWTAMSMAVTSLSVAYTDIFGSDEGFGIFLTALISTLAVIMGFYIYKTWAGRNPD